MSAVTRRNVNTHINSLGNRKRARRGVGRRAEENEHAIATLETKIEARIIPSEALGILVRDGFAGVATKLTELRPLVEELWKRLGCGETILGCTTKKQFCAEVLRRTPRSVRYLLDGGNHCRGGETVSPPNLNLNLFEDNSIAEQADPVLSPTEAKAQELTSLLEGVFGKGQGRAKSTCDVKLNWRVVRYDVFKVTLILTEDRLRELAQRMSRRVPQ